MSNNIQLLIVDDEVRFLQTLKERLQIRGFDVTAVTNGTHAIEAARCTRFDVALLDLKMPGMDGEEVLRILKLEHPLLEVIILTGHGSIESAVDCTKAGSHSYLQKPCETDELLEVLKDAYSKRVQRKLELDKKKLDELLGIATGESPLGIIRRLRELERGAGEGDA
jgi:DNA-binding NtrC family response regulator